MRIERIQVEEGFLDGLDLEFRAGLNVLIGARGTGKTSIIELLRYCLAAQAFTDEAALRGQQQALSILGSGRVRVTLDVDGDRVVVTRSGQDPPDTVMGGVTVLAQNEIEAVGVHASGRMHVIDRYRQDSPVTTDLRAVITSLRTSTAELRAALTELLHLREQALALSSAQAELAQAQAEQAELLQSVAATEGERQRLENLQSVGAELGAARVVLEKGLGNLTQFGGSLDALPDARTLLDQWPNASDPLLGARQLLERVESVLDAAKEGLHEAQSAVEEIAERNRRQRLEVDDDSRQLRASLNALQEGAGEVTRRVDSLRERVGQLEAIEALIRSREEHVREVYEQRRSVYGDLDRRRELRFQERTQIADRLNVELEPRIRVVLTRSAGTSEFVAAIVAALRGSGLHYNELAPQLAENLTPLELLELAETGQVEQLAQIAGITQQRAQAVVNQLLQADTTDVIAAPIEDAADFFLLDGGDYKPTSQLSIGQRCTVVLPLLLSQHGDVLVVDQPEDHIDNAFIASTLVATLRARHSSDQLIFSSHNPNIPVLGNADYVVHMESDGRRGFARARGALEDRSIVHAITTVMEGGAEAFDARARFYGSAVTPEQATSDD